MLDYSKVYIEVLDDSIQTMEFGKCKNSSEIDKVVNRYWLQHIVELDFSAKINEKLSTYLPSQLMNCIG